MKREQELYYANRIDGTPAELMQEAKRRIDECYDIYYIACCHLRDSINRLILWHDYDLDFGKVAEALAYSKGSFSELIGKTNDDLCTIATVISDLELCISNIEKGQKKKPDFFLETNEQ